MHQLWPPVDVPSTLTRQVWDADTARTIPGVGRALGIYELIGQCALDDFRGIVPVTPRPRLLERPDPDRSRPHFIKAHVNDYLLHGNACHLVTARDANGWPAAARWFPAHQWQITEEDGAPVYWLNGRRVDRPRDVIHVQRGSDPVAPFRGVGVVEQHVRALNRVGLQEAGETENLRGRGMPGVAIITPQREPKESDLDAAADKWAARFEGSRNLPAFLPAGTQVVPLAWSPNDQQMTEARKLSLVDVANIFNLDSYWLGAPGSSHTYRSVGPLFVSLLRTSLEGVLVELEDVWSYGWLPHGRRVRFDRAALSSDDLAASITTARSAYESRLWTWPEVRTFLGLDPTIPEPENNPPPAPAPPPPDPEPPVEELEDDQLDDEEIPA
jgi:HK97 family phage portal protein